MAKNSSWKSWDKRAQEKRSRRLRPNQHPDIPAAGATRLREWTATWEDHAVCLREWTTLGGDQAGHVDVLLFVDNKNIPLDHLPRIYPGLDLEKIKFIHEFRESFV